MVQQVSVFIIPRPSTLEEVQCVCVFIPFILDIKFVGRTSRGHTGFLKPYPAQQVNITVYQASIAEKVYS